MPKQKVIANKVSASKGASGSAKAVLKSQSKMSGSKIASANKKTAPAAGGIKEHKHRFRPGTVALREIKKYQKSTKMMLPRAPF